MEMSRKKLYVHFEAQSVGLLEEDDNGLLLFSYAQEWLENKDAFPLSLAMSLQDKAYQGKIVTSFFENLIPEGEQRRQLERIAGLPESNDLAFLERFGNDCAGALSISSQANDAKIKRQIQELPISFEAIEKAIENGQPVQAAFDHDGELPPFSLAGAQAKFPCCIDNSRITIPVGKPTTYIIKLPIRSGDKLLDSVENEYLSMRLAEKCGLPVPRVMILGKRIPLFAIERFDRIAGDHGIRRIHTQDLCQALGRPSKEKYEKHGGPSFSDCYNLIRDHSSTAAKDLLALLDWVGFNLALGNNDSHAKNISLIHTMQGTILAPFYDLISTALYPQYNSQFAFRIAEVSSWDKITSERVNAFAKKTGLRGDFVSNRWRQVFEKLRIGINDMAEEASERDALAKTFRKISKECKKRIQHLDRSLMK
jgi:serine/threonine-protein kinase HipA